MKRTGLLFICICSLIACSRKTVPAKTAVPAPIAPASVHLPSALIVIDGYGRILTPPQKLPKDSGLKPDYSKIARSFTPQQIANLKARYHTVPPKVLYVPDQYAIKSYRGTYCIYLKKFWYWKKPDGLFYLDENDYE